MKIKFVTLALTLLVWLSISTVSAEIFNGKIDVVIPDNIDSENVRFDHEGYYFEAFVKGFEIKWDQGSKLSNSRGTNFNRETGVGVSRNSRTFKDILDGVNMELIVENQQLKENIILSSKPFPGLGQNGNVAFVLRLEIDDRLTINTNGKYYNLNDDFTTDSWMAFYDEGIPRFSFPKPFAIDANGNQINVTYRYESTSFLGFFFKRSYLSVLVPKDFLVNAAYPVIIDPSAIAGCTTTSTTVECHDGTFTGNDLSTSLNISILNATINGQGSPGEVDLDSTGGWITIVDSTLDGLGVGECSSDIGCAGELNINAAQFITLDNSLLIGNGASDCSPPGLNGCDGGDGSATLITGSGWNITVNTSTVVGQGGIGKGATATTSCGDGGSGNAVVITDNINVVGGTFNLDGEGEDGSCQCQGGSDATVGGNGVVSVTANLFTLKGGSFSFKGEGQTAFGCLAGASNAGGGNGQCTLIANNVDALMQWACDGGDRFASLGTVGSATMNFDSVFNATHFWKAGSFYNGQTGAASGLKNSTVKYKANTLTLHNTSFSWTGFKSTTETFINISGEPSRFGIFGNGNMTPSANGFIHLHYDAPQYLIGGQNNDSEILPQSPPIQFRSTFGEYFAPYVNLTIPLDNSFPSSSPIEFVCGAQAGDGLDVVNLSLFHDGTGSFVEEGVVTTSANVVQASFNESFIDGTFVWSCGATDSQNNFSLAGINRTFTLDSTNPVVSVIRPTGTFGYAEPGDTTLLTLEYIATDLNLQNDSCVYEYPLGTFNNITCGINNISLPVQGASDTNLVFFANDTAGNQANDSTSWTYTLFQSNESFNENTTETASETFTIDLNFNSTEFPAITGIFTYGNTTQVATKTGSVDDVVFTATKDIPLGVGVNQFFWNISVTNTTGTFFFNSPFQNQTVSLLQLAACNATVTTQAINFTSEQEDNLTRINPFLFEATFDYFTGDGGIKKTENFPLESVSEKTICISPAFTNVTINAKISYDGPTTGVFVPRDYNFNNDVISNVSQNITLFLLPAVDSTTFIIKVRDSVLLPVPQALVLIQRFYPGTNSFETVQVAITGDDGKTVGFFKTETVDYRFIVKVNGETKLTTNKQKIVAEQTPSTIILTIGGDVESPIAIFEDIENLEATLEFNDATQIVTYTYTDTSGNLTLGRLLVEKIRLDQNNIVICNVNSTDSSASLICDLDGLNGTFNAQGFIERSPETLSIAISFVISTVRDVFGNTGLILSWFIILTAAMTGIWNPTVGIILVDAAVIFVNLLGMATFPPLAIFSLLGLSLIMIILIKT